MAKPDIDSELDHLYALPLAEFIGARNELAKRLKVAGEPAAAAEVKALAKPSVTAWAVNALFHQERERFDALLAAAAAVRAGLAGKGDRRQAEAEKRQATKALLGRAAKILTAAGHAATPANRQRISHTLEALAARDPEAAGPAPGRLTADLQPQGFDVLAGLAASLAPAAVSAGAATGGAKKPAGRSAGKAAKKGTAKASAAAEARDERREAARQKLAEEKARLGRLERQAEAADAAAAEAAKQHRRLAEEAAEAALRAGAARRAATAAEDELAAARAAAANAKAARRRGLSRVATARRALERL